MCKQLFFVAALFNTISICVAQNGGTSMLQFLPNNQDLITSASERPVIHTLMYGIEAKQAYDTDELVRIWAESWSSAGWNPIFLNEKDAQLHPGYDAYVTQLQAANIPENRWDRYFRYIAMSQIGGGWYSEAYILPIRSDLFDGKAFALPNAGKFTMHETELPELLSGSKDEWSKLCFLMMNEPRNNDAVLLKNLVNDNPELLLVEDSVVNARYVLDANLRYELCDLLDRKLAAKYSYQIAQYAGFTRKYYYDAVKSSLNELEEKCRVPVMNTFFEPAYDNYSKLLVELEEWKKAWKAAGWRPVVLKMEDAKKHPSFERFEKAFEAAEYKTSEYDRMCFYRWLAMAATNGGWMSDYDTYPLFLDAYQDGLNLPNDGKFTGYNIHVPCLISGTKKEWERMSQLLLFSYQRHTDVFWSDMLAFQEVEQLIKGYVATQDVISADAPYADTDARDENGSVLEPYNLKDRCHYTKGKRAIHFSHASCKRAGFCHKERGPVVAKWIEAWQQQCLLNNKQ